MEDVEIRVEEIEEEDEREKEDERERGKMREREEERQREDEREKKDEIQGQVRRGKKVRNENERELEVYEQIYEEGR